MIDPKARARYAAVSFALMRAGLVFYVLLFPLGQAPREIGAIWVTAALLCYYALDWKGSNLALYPLKWVYFAFMALIVFKTFHTIHFSLSWYAFSHNIYKGPMLFLAALEFMRRGRDVKVLAWALALASILLGVAGMIEYANHGYIQMKRYGNLMSLALPVMFGMPIMLKGFGRWRWPLTALAALPGTVYWAVAQARSGWLGLVAAGAAFTWIRLGTRRTALVFGVLIALVLILSPPRMTWEVISADARWEIWRVAVEVFEDHPILGTGINAFEPGYEALGESFDPERYEIPVPHPHNIYLQFLLETGVVGFAVFMVFLFGQLGYAIRIVRRKATRYPDPWLVAACFWCSGVGYAVTGLSAHSFFRTWWLGLAMTVLGAALGSAMCVKREFKQDFEERG